MKASRPVLLARPASNLLHISAVELAKSIEEMSGGRLKWEMMAAGTIVGSVDPSKSWTP